MNALQEIIVVETSLSKHNLICGNYNYQQKTQIKYCFHYANNQNML